MTFRKLINIIKVIAPNSRLFSTHCKEVRSDHTSRLLYAEIKWLSRGKILDRLLELEMEVGILVNDKKFILTVYFDNKNCISKHSYIADIFCIQNHLNLSLRENQSNIFTVQS